MPPAPASLQWHALDHSEQAKYYELAREEQMKHKQMYPGWSARDNYALHKKRKKVKQVKASVEDYVGEWTRESLCMLCICK